MYSEIRECLGLRVFYPYTYFSKIRIRYINYFFRVYSFQNTKIRLMFDVHPKNV